MQNTYYCSNHLNTAHFSNLHQQSSLEGVIRLHAEAFPLTTRLVFHNVPIWHLSPVWQMRKIWIWSNFLCKGYHQLHWVIHFRKTYLTDVYPNMMLWKNRGNCLWQRVKQVFQFVGNDPPNDWGVNLIHSTCRNWFPSKSATAGDFQCSTERLHGIFPSLASISYPNMRFSWWFPRFLIFNPILAEMMQFDEHILKMGGSTAKHGKPLSF